MAVGVPVCSVRYHPTTPHLLAVGSAKHAVLLYDLRAPATPLAALAGHAKAVSYVRWQEGASSNSLAAAEVKEEGGPQPMEVQGSAEGATGVHGSSSNGGGSAGSSSTALVSASVDSTLRRWVWDPAAASAAGGGGSSLAAAVSSAGAGWRCERLFSGHTTTKAFTGLSVEGPYIATGSETNEVYLYHAAMSGPAATTRLPLPGGGAGAGLGSTGDVFVSAVAWRRGGRVLLATNSAGGVYVLGLSG
jgi:WD40 repeat protein